MRKRTILALHGLAFVGLLVAAVALATWRGALWPLDLRFSALLAAGGLAILLLGWGPLWLVPLLVSAALNRYWQRLAIWPFAVLAMVAWHAAFGPTLGFLPIGRLGMIGALDLYALPVALALLLGSAVREALRRTRPPGTTATRVAVPGAAGPTVKKTV